MANDRWWIAGLVAPVVALGGVLGGLALASRRRRGAMGLVESRSVRFSPSGHGKCPYCHGDLVCERQPPPALCHSAEAYKQILPVVRRRRAESFWVFTLDARNRIIGKREVSRGSLSQTVVHPREVFAPAITKRAAAIIVAHNHPSGEPSPSPEDDALTRRLREAGKMLGIPLLDHLVICGSGGYYSYQDAGRLTW